MADTMRAVVVSRYGGALEATRRPMPSPAYGEALVRVRASGLCSTDVHLLSGRQPLGQLPRIVGHELAGDIAAIGDGVVGWRIGDRVTAAIDVTCGRCRHCLAGETQRCRAMQRIGFERDGGHADYVTVPAANLVAIPASIDYEAACILPDAVACMYHTLMHQGRVGVGQRVLILGAGGLGLHGIQIARAAGAHVFATSRRSPRLVAARECGAVAIDTGRESVADAIRTLTGGEGVDAVVDNVGTRASVREAIGLLRPGGKLLVVAYVDESFDVPSMPLFKTELEILGCRGSTKQDLIDVVEMVRAGQVRPVLGASYPLGAIADAVARLEAGDVVGRIWLHRG